MRRNNLERKLRGYQKANRARFNLITDPRFRLSAEELLLFEFYIAITDWDSKHLETYGTFDATDKEVAPFLGYKSASTINRHKNNLLHKKLIEKASNGGFSVKGFEKWELRPGRLEKVSAILDKTSAENAKENAFINKNQVQNADYSLVSFKDEFNSSEDESLSDEELDLIFGVLETKEKNGDAN